MRDGLMKAFQASIVTSILISLTAQDVQGREAQAPAIARSSPSDLSAAEPQIAAPHAILIDVKSGSALFEKAADERFAPASMAKLMTADIVFDALKAGRLSMDSEFTVTEEAWRRGGRGGGGSSMFASPNSRIKVSDLLRGLIVQSGNDAAIIIAENIAGTEDAFSGIMNQRAKEIGLTGSAFRNATGFAAPDLQMRT